MGNQRTTNSQGRARQSQCALVTGRCAGNQFSSETLASGSAAGMFGKPILTMLKLATQQSPSACVPSVACLSVGQPSRAHPDALGCVDGSGFAVTNWSAKTA